MVGRPPFGCAGVVQRARDEDVLQGVRDAQQRPIRPVAAGQRGIGGIGGRQRTVTADRQEGVQPLGVAVDARQAGLGQLVGS